MKKIVDLRIGTFLRIPLDDGSFGYGRVLANPYIAFYDYRTAAPESDLTALASKPILFIQSVRLVDSARWVNIGAMDLEGDAAKPVVRFMQDLADFRECTIFDTAGMERKATPEDCIGLERAAVWEPHHIEQRLLDTFTGRSNAIEEHLRVRLS